MQLPYLVVSDGNGNVFEIPEFYMAGMHLMKPALPGSTEFISLPQGSDLFELPGRVPVGYDPRREAFAEVHQYEGNPVYAVAAFMAPAYLQFYRSAYTTLPEAPRLPLYSYTAVGWREGQFYVPATRIDSDQRQDLQFFDMALLEKQAREKLQRHRGNRLVYHLVENCALTYGCPAARNFVLDRWECPIPTSRGCNAACIGCISEQPEKTGVVASQERLEFLPAVDEILDFVVPHLENADRPVASFGQGCEGEPLMVGSLLEETIREIRKRTNRGIININTNASRPQVIERLCQAGLDSIRISMNSAQKHYYQAYFKPRQYEFEDVVESLRIIRRYGQWASINYLVFPGFSDHPQEIAALEKLMKEVGIDMIQTRNLNIDPEWYIDELALGELSSEQVGMRNWLDHVQQNFPQVKLGYFNPPRQGMTSGSPI